MVKNVILTNFHTERTALLMAVDRKILASKVRNTNELINGKLRVDLNVITSVLSGLEAKFRKCEIIYNAYFEHIDHAVLSGNVASLPYRMECDFKDVTAQFNYIYECDDKFLYKEIIDMNFQNFILMVASIYENLVLLSEIILKKVIVHRNKQKPLSSPLDSYIDFLQILISLGYRKNDDLNRCITLFDPYFSTYLETINKLRNSYIHGYSLNLSSDGRTYKIVYFDNTSFAAGSPLLDIDTFTKTILNNSRDFILALYPVLEKGIKHHSKFIPA